MTVRETPLPGVLVVETRIFRDDRGQFQELYQLERYRAAGIDRSFVQDNLSHSTLAVLRGLHFQNPKPQAKLVSAAYGEIFDVAVDVRLGSPTFGKWYGETLSAENGRQLWIPEGFAHGFVVTSPSAAVSYKASDVYDAAADASLLWNDPAIGVEWPIKVPVLSDKDAAAPCLSQISRDRLNF